jgi:hypothetical protein
MRITGMLCLSVVALVSFALGCSADSKESAVTGTVTLDGQSLQSGNIRFDAADGHAHAAEATIADGKFSAKMAPGEKRVTITAQKVVGKKKAYDAPNSPVIDLTEEMLPKRYNAQSEIKATVAAGSSELPAFELKSK